MTEVSRPVLIALSAALIVAALLILLSGPQAVPLIVLALACIVVGIAFGVMAIRAGRKRQ
jgi:hypothetical protein